MLVSFVTTIISRSSTQNSMRIIFPKNKSAKIKPEEFQRILTLAYLGTHDRITREEEYKNKNPNELYIEEKTKRNIEYFRTILKQITELQDKLKQQYPIHQTKEK